MAEDNVIWADTDLPEEYNVLAKRDLMRHDGIEKASGKALYARDVKLPGMLYAKFLLSPYANVKITSMDTSKAEALLGVKYVLRYDDPEVAGLPAISLMGLFGMKSGPPVWLLGDRAYYEGEGFGVIVAADSEEICDEALRLIDVEWEELPFVLDQEEALKPGAPLVDETTESNVLAPAPRTFEEGDIEEGFKEADETIEWTAKRSYNSDVAPEPLCCVARYNSDYYLEVWVRTQVVGFWRNRIANQFGMPYNRVVMHTLYQGSMYGGWNWRTTSADMMPPLAVMLAMRTGRPVKVLWGRRGEFGGGTDDIVNLYCKAGFKNDGTITAVEVYAPFGNTGWSSTPWGHLVENTKIKNLSFDSPNVCVNKAPVGAVRCEQQPNVFMITTLMSRVAAALEMDPTEVALKNDGCEGHDITWLSEFKRAHGFLDRDSLREGIVAGKAAVDWDSKWHAPGARKLPNGKYHGIGFNWSHQWNNPAINSGSGVLIEPDGSVSVLCQQCDIGLNFRASAAQVVAETLGMRYEDVAFPNRAMHYTGLTCCPPAGSLAFTTSAYVLKRAAKDAKEKLLKYVTESPAFFPDKTPEELEVKDSVIFEKANPENKKTVKEVAATTNTGGFLGFGGAPPIYSWKFEAAPFNPGSDYEEHFLGRQCYFLEVEVDPETGLVEVTNIVNVNDVGKICSPEACEGQQYGGDYMGVSRALTEEHVYDPATGVQLNSDLLNYKVATIKDVPHDSIDCLLLETGLGYGPWGMIGIGEDIATVVPQVLGPAVYNAIGKWVEDYPITPDKVLKALGKV